MPPRASRAAGGQAASPQVEASPAAPSRRVTRSATRSSSDAVAAAGGVDDTAASGPASRAAKPRQRDATAAAGTKSSGAAAVPGRRAAKTAALPAVREDGEEAAAPRGQVQAAQQPASRDAGAAGAAGEEEDEEALVVAAAAAVRRYLSTSASGAPGQGAAGLVAGRGGAGGGAAAEAAPSGQTTLQGAPAVAAAVPAWEPESRLPQPLRLRDCAPRVAVPGGGDGHPAGTLFHPPPEAVRSAARKAAKAAAAASAGPQWFDMKAPAMTEEVKRDLKLLRLRGVADPKRFYKKADTGKLPTHFAMGTVVESAADFYSGRMVKGDRRQTVGEEMLADAHAASYRANKFAELQATAQAAAPRRRNKRKGMAPLPPGPKKPRHATRRANV